MAKKTDKKVIEEAIKRYKDAHEAEDDNIERAKAAIRFRDLEQWPDQIKDARENDPEGARPCLVLDKTNQYINQVKNDQRQNRPAIKVRPIDDDADVKTAEVFQGIIRHIEDVSQADIAYDTGFEAAADGGFGYWRIVTEYVDDESFDQEPRILRIRNRFSVLLDYSRQMPDGSDAKWGFIFERLSHDEFKAQYPDAKPVSFEEYGDSAPEWVGQEDIVIAEYFRIKTINETLTVGEKTRKVKKNTVEWFKLTAAEVLDFRVLPGKYIPIVEIVGNEIDLEGKRRTSGLIRGAMDAMRMYNYAASAYTEMVSLAPRAPWVAAVSQLENREEEWRSANRRNISVLQYNPVLEGGLLVPQPQRSQMPGIPIGWQQAMANFEHDIQSAMGMYASNLGADTDATSGKQELALQRRGDTSTFHYIDNLSRSLRHTGKILIDLIPKLYDTERIARLLGEDDTEDFARLDPEQKEAFKTIPGSEGPLNYYNLNVGRYDVAVTVGPAYTTKRMEAADWLTRMVTAKPELMQVIGDLMFKALDMPFADKAAERMKKMLPPQLQEDEESNLPPEVQAAVAQAQAMIEQQKQGLAAAAQQIEEMQENAQKVGQAAQSDTAQAKAARDALRLEEEKLKNSHDALKRGEEVFAKEVEVQKLEMDKAVEEFQKQMAQAANEDAEKRMQMEGSATAAMSQALAENQQQIMQAMQAMLEEMARPKVKHARVTAESGRVYELTTTEGEDIKVVNQ